jgi:hypothetical protein
VALVLSRFFNSFGDGNPTSPSNAVLMQEFA